MNTITNYGMANYGFSFGAKNFKVQRLSPELEKEKKAIEKRLDELNRDYKDLLNALKDRPKSYCDVHEERWYQDRISRYKNRLKEILGK